MARPTTYRPGKFTIWVGDGASPEDFTSKTCGFNTKTIAFAHGSSDVSVPDCDDPDAAIWTERSPTASSVTVSGAGVMADETFDFWNDWQLDRTAKNVRIVIDRSVPGFWEGSFLISAFETTGNYGDGKINVSVTLVNDGEVFWAAGSP
jgi:predicted secreted protein